MLTCFYTWASAHPEIDFYFASEASLVLTKSICHYNIKKLEEIIVDNLEYIVINSMNQFIVALM